MNKEDEIIEGKAKRGSVIKRLWKRFKTTDWKDPLNRWKLLFFLVLTFIGLAGGSYGAIAATSTNTFCASCHEMSPEAVTHKVTSHSQVNCVDCHIKPGIDNKIKSKIGAMKELYHHVTRTVPNPIYAHKKVEDVVCVKCHSFNRMVTATGDLIVNHEGHIEAEIPCLTCHSGVAHAKVVERGLNTHDAYDHWIEENADILVKTAYTSPNMGTCIDCHDKVNQGLKPWEDISYVMSSPPSSIEEGHKVDDKSYTSNLILQGLGKQHGDVELSMDCLTCHLEVATPLNHQKHGWNENHGSYALTDLNNCLTCHEEAKWIKRVAATSIDEILNPGSKPNLEFYVPDIFVVKSESRNSIFCFTCHTERPPGHGDDEEWLTGHADFAETKQQKRECYVCHDYEKNESQTAATDVYCMFCHRTGLKDAK
ncbi:cytochrome c3 family protein [Anaerobacillus isosaccharinicus]|nr:NapC/NirT family cytochrome c [Anaerobacillus isosaccharinicus]